MCTYGRCVVCPEFLGHPSSCPGYQDMHGTGPVTQIQEANAYSPLPVIVGGHAVGLPGCLAWPRAAHHQVPGQLGSALRSRLQRGGREGPYRPLSADCICSPPDVTAPVVARLPGMAKMAHHQVPGVTELHLV